MQSYLKCIERYDRKAKAAFSQQKGYGFILQPIADHHGSKVPSREFRWIGPYIVEKALLNENFIVKKLNPNKTQISHRVRLRKYEPNSILTDNRPEGNLRPTKISSRIIIFISLLVRRILENSPILAETSQFQRVLIV